MGLERSDGEVHQESYIGRLCCCRPSTIRTRRKVKNGGRPVSVWGPARRCALGGRGVMVGDVVRCPYPEVCSGAAQRRRGLRRQSRSRWRDGGLAGQG